jgi:hypothetical protein
MDCSCIKRTSGTYLGRCPLGGPLWHPYGPSLFHVSGKAACRYREARVTLGSHQRCVGKSQVHLTPKWLIDALGPFDLDPCAALSRPWNCARTNWTEADDGLALEWHGLVWLNPPFDRYQVGKWIQKLAEHGNGIALVHARTEADWFQPIWRSASLALFLRKRLKFCRPDGSEQPANSGAPAVLAAFGRDAEDRLLDAEIPGAYVSNHGSLARYLEAA